MCWGQKMSKATVRLDAEGVLDDLAISDEVAAIAVRCGL